MCELCEGLDARFGTVSGNMSAITVGDLFELIADMLAKEQVDRKIIHLQDSQVKAISKMVMAHVYPSVHPKDGDTPKLSMDVLWVVVRAAFDVVLSTSLN